MGSNHQNGALVGVLHHALNDFGHGDFPIPVGQRRAEYHEVELSFAHFIDNFGLRISEPDFTFCRDPEAFQAVPAACDESFHVLALIFRALDPVDHCQQFCLGTDMS